MAENFKVGDIAKSNCGSVGEIVYILRGKENDDNPKCVVLTGFPFEGAEQVFAMCELSEYIPGPGVLTSPF